MAINTEISEKLKELIKKADEKKVWGDPTFDSRTAAILLSRALPDGGQINCWEAMSQDLKTMCIFEIVRMWCDPVSGLANVFPDQVVKVSEYILNNY
jgi:hypothetical protein